MSVAFVKTLESGAHDDGFWLNQFLRDRQSEAFAKLVERHGAMVHAVSRRVLHHGADAEDAAQATFLILASKAHTIRRRNDLGGWLFGVARKVALQLLRERERRARRERNAHEEATQCTPDVLEAQEAARLCDVELARLPQRYQQVLVLSCMEGLPKSLIAQRLRLPEGTVASHLSRGKKMLAERLIRRGLAPAIATAILSTSVVQAIPGSLTQLSRTMTGSGSTLAFKQLALPGAWELFQKVEYAMWMKRGLVALVCTVGLGIGVPSLLWGWQVLSKQDISALEPSAPPVQQTASKRDDTPGRSPLMTDKELLQGRWMLVAFVSNSDAGNDHLAGVRIGSMLEFQDETVKHYGADGTKLESPKEVQNQYRLNDKVQPKELDVVMMAPNKVVVIPGLYSLQHDTLIICTSEPFNTRPIEIGAARNGSTKLAIYRRVVPPGTVSEERKRITEEAAISQTSKSLRDCLIAMHNYHNDYNRLPSPAIFDKSTGKPLLSWRVLLLPYLGHDKLYKEFHLEEPWDSEHNKTLIARMPAIFAHPVSPSAQQHKTHYRVFVSPAVPSADASSKFAPTLSLSPKHKSTLGQIAVGDGTSNTIALVEAAEAVIWTKPEEIELANDTTDIPALGAIPASPYFVAVHWDGASHLYRKTGVRMSREGYVKMLRQQIGWNDGMAFDPGGIMVR